MKIQILCIAFLFSNFARSQDAPEYLKFVFKDSAGKRISPELTVKETRIFWRGDRLIMKKSTLQADTAQPSSGKTWSYEDEQGIEWTVVSSITGGHTLGQEISIEALYENRLMHITFFGQGMLNFDCWNRLRPEIVFQEGYFHCYAIKRQVTGVFTPEDIVWIKTSKAIEIFQYPRVNAVKMEASQLGLNPGRELVPLPVLLKSREFREGGIYTGFIFNRSIPLGYGVASKGKLWFVTIQKEAMASIEKYYQKAFAAADLPK